MGLKKKKKVNDDQPPYFSSALPFHLSNFPGVPLGQCDFWDSDQVCLSELGDVSNVDKVVDALPLSPWLRGGATRVLA